MKRALVAALVTLLAVGMAQRFSVEAGGGFYGGLGGQVAVVAEDFAPGLPLGVRLGVGFATSDALDDNFDLGGGQTFGRLKSSAKLSEWGQNITVSLDFIYKVSGLAIPAQVAPYVGVRYNLFSGGFTDPQNNLPNSKAYTASSDQIGLGGGVRLAYPLAPNLSLVGDLGADYYFKACIQGREEPDSRNPTTSTVCPNDSNYNDADRLVTQPEWVLKLRLGVAYRF